MLGLNEMNEHGWTYRSMIDHMIKRLKLKMLAIPRARPRIMERTPSLDRYTSVLERSHAS